MDSADADFLQSGVVYTRVSDCQVFFSRTPCVPVGGRMYSAPTRGNTPAAQAGIKVEGFPLVFGFRSTSLSLPIFSFFISFSI